jgi:hypothetical protein
MTTQAQKGGRGIAFPFTTSALERVGCQHQSPNVLPPRKNLLYRFGGPWGRSGRARKISPPPGIDPPIDQALKSRYTDWTTLAVEDKISEKITEFLSHLFCPFSCLSVYEWKRSGGVLSLALCVISCKDWAKLLTTAVSHCNCLPSRCQSREFTNTKKRVTGNSILLLPYSSLLNVNRKGMEAWSAFDINVSNLCTLQLIIVEAATVLQRRKVFQRLLRMAIAARALSTRKRGKASTRESPSPGYP